jgi:hypothetical protein
MYKSIILPVLLYLFETWPHAKGKRLRVFENMVLWRIFGERSDGRLEKTV